MRVDDLIITVAYFSIPLQIVLSLYKYPRLHVMPLSLKILIVLFAFFIFLCGAGHALRCNNRTHGLLYEITNILTAFVSLATCLYLIPLVPSVMSTLNGSLYKLECLNQELEASQRKLKTFMAFLCHEIRNPLFVITSNISFMEDNDSQESPSSEVQSQALQAISQSAEIMLRLVNDVLDISKLEAGKLELQEHEFDLREILMAISSSKQRLIERRHGDRVKFSTVIVENDDDDDDDNSNGDHGGHCCLPARVYGDSIRFLQIAYNLLSNANKFTTRGEIQFRVSVVRNVALAVKNGWVKLPNDDCGNTSIASTKRMSTTSSSSAATKEEEEEDGLFGGVDYGNFLSTKSRDLENVEDYEDDDDAHQEKQQDRLYQDFVVVKMQVKDTGDGIPPDQIDLLFQPYAQAKLASYRHQGGTGLGLSIVSKLTKAMGGNIYVQSEVGKGSTFEVYLPLRKTSTTPHRADGGDDGGINKTSSFPSMPSGISTFCKVTNSYNKVQPVDVEMGLPSSPTQEVHVLNNKSSSAPSPKTIPSSNDRTINKRSNKKQPLSPFDYPHTVLVVDDNDMNRKILKRMLTQFQLHHVEASNGKEAIDILLQSRNFTQNPTDPQIDMVLMDISMPIMDGCQATKIIRQQYHEYFKDLPIIALTAATIEEGKHKALEVGVTEYQTKPIKRDVLYSLCQRHLSKMAGIMV